MVQIERILCPVDFAAASGRALEHAAALARWFTATVTALHVRPAAPPHVAASSASPREDPVGLRRRLGVMLERAGAGGAAGQGLLLEGDPATEILRHAEESRADLLVLGSTGEAKGGRRSEAQARSGPAGRTLGSVTESVLRRAPCPVLSVTTGARAHAAAAKALLCAVDFSEASLRGLEFALALAQEERSRVVLLHVVDALPSPADEALFLSPEFGARVTEQAGARLQALVPVGADDWSIPEARVRVGRAAGEILAAAREERADLIVMGARPQRFAAPGSWPCTVRHVMSGADCPVLAVPAAGPFAAPATAGRAETGPGVRTTV